jgi:hypothetical protein
MSIRCRPKSNPSQSTAFRSDQRCEVDGFGREGDWWVEAPIQTDQSFVLLELLFGKALGRGR